MTIWSTSSFADVVELQRGHDLPTTDRRRGAVPIIGSFGVTGAHDVARYPGPGVAIGRSGAAIGKATMVNGPFWPLNTCLFVKNFKGNDPRWVYWLLKTTDFAQFNSGSAQPSLNRNFLRKIPVPVPTPAEQRAIAEVLGALDDKIAANAGLILKSEELALTLTSVGRQRTTLDEVVRVSRHVQPPSAFAERVWHYSLLAFDDGQRPVSNKREDIKSAKLVLGQSCVLISKLNPRFPRVWDIPVLLNGASVASTEFVVLQPSACSTSVLWAMLAQPAFGTALESKVAGTSGSHQRVKPADLLATEVIDPRFMPLEVQAKVTNIGLFKDQVRKESLRLQELRDTLLPPLMSGRLRVRDVEKQVEAAV